MSTASNSSLKQSCSAFTSVTSALEVNFNVMHSTYLLTYVIVLGVVVMIAVVVVAAVVIVVVLVVFVLAVAVVVIRIGYDGYELDDPPLCTSPCTPGPHSQNFL